MSHIQEEEAAVCLRAEVANRHTYLSHQRIHRPCLSAAMGPDILALIRRSEGVEVIDDNDTGVGNLTEEVQEMPRIESMLPSQALHCLGNGTRRIRSLQKLTKLKCN